MASDLHLPVDRASGLPLHAQLARRIRQAVSAGELAAGERLPSVRDLAESVGVHVNTVRAVYARLESEGVVRSEHGRGTFVADSAAGSGARPVTRRELREQIAALEATLSRLPPPPVSGEPPQRKPGAALLSTDQLVEVRDRLVERLEQLDAERSALIESLEGLGLEAPPQGRASARRSTPSLAGARIRWLGA
ncbi:MAG TPA: GntR family transcriptional regulator [Thermoleophilaceae bacterium]|nr:GntR family transcriptional regulator [Thermoleophilaceae bacterium]